MNTLVRVKSWRSTLVAAAMVLGAAMFGAPQTAQAVPMTGSIAISGLVDTPTDTGGVDFVGSGAVIAATGDLSVIPALFSPVALFDLDFGSPFPQLVWSVTDIAFGTFTFSLTGLVTAVVPNGQNGIGFTAVGLLTGTGFDDTTGVFVFDSGVTGGLASFQSVTSVPLPASLLLFSGGIAGLGMLAMRRRKKAGSAIGGQVA